MSGQGGPGQQSGLSGGWARTGLRHGSMVLAVDAGGEEGKAMNGAGTKWGPLSGPSAAHNEVAQLLRSWLDQAGCTVPALIDRFTPEHFGDGAPPRRTATYERLAGRGLTWEFIEAVVDVTTDNAALQERRLAEARAPWDAACQRAVSRREPVDSHLAHRALDLAEQLRQAEQREGALLAERDRMRQVARALLMICERIRQRVDDLRLAQARGQLAEEDSSVLAWKHRLQESEWQQVVAEMERDRAQRMLVEWSQYVADLSRSLLPGGRPGEPQPTIARASAPPALDLQDGELADVDRMLGLTGQEVEIAGEVLDGFSDEFAHQNGTGEGFLQSVRLVGGQHVGLSSLPIIRSLQKGVSFHSGITVLAGPNGSGKSAVLEALALLTHCRFSNGGLPHGLSSLSRVIAGGLEARWSTSREPESRLFVSYLGTSPEGSDALLEGMDGPNRLFLLDEPEAGLHPEASARQVQWMYERVEQGCQFVIATHSMTLASLSRARIIRFRPERPP
ncbi:AAA family ATPase [Streptomyces sp. NPDC050759]|uniref:AAA family ATPase n=1 Tax=Streptomyces sp. NPDC050759 TaxID=3365635 RepID=UPI0037941BD4